ncbi:uncharacterized protein TRIADDRAFT_64138 [Trichoplax adhaerens]|uniref:Endonuclease n=1 Tax=Trichoplax adhaerens TaxID=10228 RepID=B3S3V7_TRIAD|nr:hypothetical protein TRIADDRAFT_64138 [Trichoplax adhaerens]EDV22532.1 hypothetical protein TRIADDRAFT_64138 [Trichoplax adhaerens]|eukprot:XP_002115076.1 hypothetical protein TRIADDRAFT_64138 [Trichoplax adhaerens]
MENRIEREKLEVEGLRGSNKADARRKNIIYVVGGILVIGVVFGLGFMIGWFANQRGVNQGQQGGNLCPTSSPTAQSTYSTKPATTQSTNSATPEQSTTAPPATTQPATKQPTTPPATTLPPITFPPCSITPAPLLVISLNGFRWDYLNRGQTPNISAFASKGTQADYMKPVFPTQTLPNLYSILTGLYPVSHGIVADNFYDPNFQETFDFKGVNGTQEKWWGGEPIWVTANKNNITTASYFWPGDQANFQGYHPNYRFPPNMPQLITMTFDQVQLAGARYGPTSNEVNQEIKNIDNAIGAITQGLKQRNAEHCVNVIITSDHGKYIDVDKNQVVNQGAFGGILVNGGNATEVVSKIKGRSSKFTVFKKEDLPFRFHYRNNTRIPDVIVVMVDGYLVRRIYDANYTACGLATSGWDNLEKDMRTIFMASGPGFHSSKKIKPFLNIQLYNVMTKLLGIKPAKNNGVLGSLRAMLRNPGVATPQAPSQPGPVCRIPADTALFEDRARCSSCVCPYCRSVVKANLTLYNQALNMTTQEESAAQMMNFPWGIPEYRVSLDTCILYQNHYITSYSNTYRVPWFVGYEITTKEASGFLKRNDCFRRDLRLSIASQASNCTSYSRSGYDRGHMAPNGDMNFDAEAQANTYLLSNIAPQIHNFNAGPWLNLESLTRTWAKKYGSVYVLSGSLVLGDRNKIWSDPSYWIHGAIDTVVLPTHFYKIFVKCQTTKKMADSKNEKAIDPCQGKIDVISFVLPHLNSRKPQGQLTDVYLLDHTTSIRDIEALSGINFFPNLPSQVQDEIEVPVASEMWAK